MFHTFALALLVVSGAVQSQPNPSLVRVFVQTDDRGEARELAARRESVRDVAAALAGKKKSIVVVDDEEKADVVVEILERGVTVPKVVIGIGARPGQPPGMTGPLRVVVLRATLTFDDEPIAFVNKNKPAETGRGWKSAAEDLGAQMEKWIAANRGEILRKRR